VSNAGNITLTNVRVFDNKPTNNTPVFGPVTLSPGQVRGYTNSYTVPLDQCGPWNDTVTVTATSICGSNVSNTASASCPAITSPAIIVTKRCPTNATAPGALLTFSGTVSNSGNITLLNVRVFNNQPTNNTLVFGPVTLAPNEVRAFTNSYLTPPDTCGPWNDTLTALATSLCGSNISHSASASCPYVTTPKLGLVKNCPTNPIPFGGLLIYNGYVSNAGNITLTNIIVVDNKPTNNTPVIGPITLAPGQIARFTNSYSVEDDCCGPYADMLSASGYDKCTGTNVVRTSTAVCQGITFPALAATLTCPNNAVVVGDVISFTGLVTNVGNVVMSNVVVTGSGGTVLLSLSGFTPGEWWDFSGTLAITNCSSGFVTNVVTLAGSDICEGVRVTTTTICIFNCQTGQGVALASPTVTGNKYGFIFPTEQSKQYTVQYTDSLLSPISWHPLTNVLGNGLPASIQDTGTNFQRYYRVIQAP